MIVAISIFFGLLMDFGADGKIVTSPAHTSPNPVFQRLRCYQCENQPNNSYCSRPEDLALCQTATIANVCTTKVSKSLEHGLRITKTCDTGPCDLGTVGSMALGFATSCDLTKPTYICNSCCSGDGCNVNTGVRSTYTDGGLLIILMISFIRVFDHPDA